MANTTTAATKLEKQPTKVLMLDVQLDRTTGESFIKKTLEDLGYSDCVHEVKWYRNKFTKLDENIMKITFKTPDWVQKAISNLNGQMIPNSTMPFNLISFPPNSPEENIAFANKYCHGLKISGFHQQVGSELIKERISKYYASLQYVEVLARSLLPQAIIWFADVRERDLALKQLSGLKVKFGNHTSLPLSVKLFPSTVDELVLEDRVNKNSGRESEVTPSQCKSNWGFTKDNASDTFKTNVPQFPIVIEFGTPSNSACSPSLLDSNVEANFPLEVTGRGRKPEPEDRLSDMFDGKLVLGRGAYIRGRPKGRGCNYSGLRNQNQ